MTLEEAKQLKPGDKVLLEAEVTTANSRKPYEHMTFHGNVAVMIAVCGTNAASCSCVSPEAIREKIAPQRRKFKIGDIVRVTNDIPHAPFIVREDEGAATIKIWGEGIGFKYVEADKLTLICAVEDRADRSAAANGSGVTRKGGEV